MAFGIIKVTPEELVAAANQLNGYLKTVERCFSTIRNTMSATQGYWVGQAGDAHRELYNSQINQIEELLRRYQEHVSDLHQMAGVYNEAESQAQTQAEELPILNL